MSSMTYYELNCSVMSDEQYDGISHQLVEIMAECPNKEESQYWYAFNDFDASTGFDLASRLTPKDHDYILRLSLCALRYSPDQQKEKALDALRNKEIFRLQKSNKKPSPLDLLDECDECSVSEPAIKPIR